MHAREEQPSMVVNQAMKKYGIENFIFEVICSILPVSDEKEYCKTADDIEEYFIQQYQSHIDLGKGYNVYRGGNSYPRSEEFKQMIRDRWKNPYYRKTHLHNGKKGWFKKGSKPWIIGKHHSDESKEKNRLAHLGKEAPNKGKNKYSEELMEQVKQECLNGRSHSELQQQFNIPLGMIKKIVRNIKPIDYSKWKSTKGKTWKLIEGKRVYFDKVK